MRGAGRRTKRTAAVAKVGRQSERNEQDDKRTCLGGGVKPVSGGGGIFKCAAVTVLRLKRKLMTTGDITKVALENGHIKCQGKTPEATMASALYTDVKRKHAKSVFTRPQEGLFGLREWIDEGFFPEGWVGPIDGLGLAPFKKRNAASLKSSRTHGVSGRSCRARSSAPSSSCREPTSSDPEEGEDEEMDEEGEEGADDENTEDTITDDEEIQPSSPGKLNRSGVGRGAAGGSVRGRGGTPAAVLAAHANGRGPAQSAGSGAASEPLSDVPDAEPHSKSHLDHASPQPSAPVLASEDVPDSLESPLELLGEAARALSSKGAEDEFVVGARRMSTGGSARRKRRPACLLMPEGGGASEASGPRSPYDDSLAALHEIATSPLSYSLFDGKQPQLPQHQQEQLQQQQQQRGGNTQQLHLEACAGLPSFLLPGGGGGAHHGFLNDAGSLFLNGLTSPYLNMPDSAGGGLLLPPGSLGSGRTPMLSLSLSGLPSPHLIDTLTPGGSGLMSLQMPYTLPLSRPDMLSAALQHAGLGGLISPPSTYTCHQLPHAPSLVLHPGMPQRHDQPTAAASAARVASSGAAASPPSPEYGKMSREQVDAQMAEIGKVKAVVERLEARMGRNNPQVGKAWLSLARMYQHVGGSWQEGMVAAAEALSRALTVCRQFSRGLDAAVPAACDESFVYLMDRVGREEQRGRGGA